MGFSPLQCEQAPAFHMTCRDLLGAGSFQLPLGCGSWMDLFPPAFPFCHSWGMLEEARLALNSQLGCSQNSSFLLSDLIPRSASCSFHSQPPTPLNPRRTAGLWGFFFQMKMPIFKAPQRKTTRGWSYGPAPSPLLAPGVTNSCGHQRRDHPNMAGETKMLLKEIKISLKMLKTSPPKPFWRLAASISCAGVGNKAAREIFSHSSWISGG